MRLTRHCNHPATQARHRDKGIFALQMQDQVTFMKNYASLCLAAAAILLSPNARADSALTVTGMRCEYTANPRGIDSMHPRLSWQLQSDARGQRQTAYEVLVARTPSALARSRGELWDSGKVVSDRSTAIAYAGAGLHAGEQCWWKVRVWDKDKKLSQDSPAASWQMGLLKPSDWQGQWITTDAPRNTLRDGNVLPPCPYLRRSFALAKPIAQATLFATARGMVELHLNGAKVGDAVLAPGWTDYRKRIEYQTYDVTKALHPGANTVGAILGDGWYSGYIGFARKRDYYGSRPQLRLQINIEYADGTRQTVASDGAWRYRLGPITYSDMLQGEAYDARREMAGWDNAGAQAAGWRPVSTKIESIVSSHLDVTAPLAARIKNNALSVTASNDLAGDPALNTAKTLRVDYTLGGAAHAQTVNEGQTLQIPGPTETPGTLVIRHADYGALGAAAPAAAKVLLVGMHGPPVRVTQHLPARRVTQPTPGAYIFDLGQNMVGWARLKVHGPAGTQVRLRFGEMLSPDGTLYTANLRTARATDTYTCRGSGSTEVWEPHFTFHGFRYVEVTGYPGKPPLGAITGCVVGSDTPPAGTFTCSQPMVNQLQHNIVWGQRGNFLSVPTDCPQRDERLGWMGDAQIFVRTATYNRDTASFYEKWMQDVDDAQASDGGFSDVSPRLVDDSNGAPAWGDAGVIVPWTVYQAYGDTEIVRRHWPAMTRWLDYITSANPNGLWIKRRSNNFGDWLSIAADTPKDVLATAYYAYDASLMARMARALGRPAEAAKYEALFAHVKAAFNTAYVGPDGRVKGDTQTDYVLALRFGLLPDSLRTLAAQHLAANIAAKNTHLSTGFVGVGYLCPVLTETGHNDVAYQLLLSDTFPSWGYSIKQGATTIWERWDGYTQDKGFQSPGMNSFNHYSLGSVGQWLYQDVAGIDTDPNRPGYKHILLHPHPGRGLTHARATYDSIQGRIASDWTTKNGQFAWTVTIPANTTATAWIPTGSPAAVTEGGKQIGLSPGIVSLGAQNGSAVCELQSGTYRFAAPLSAH